MKQLTLEFDGSCKPNPNGIAKYAYCIKNEAGEIIKSQKGVVGYDIISKTKATSSNIAEYCGLIYGLKAIPKEERKNIIINIFSDSKLLVGQMTGSIKVESKNLIYLNNISKETCSEYASVSFKWVERSKNRFCDKLAKS